MDISRVRCHFIPPWLLERLGLPSDLDRAMRAERERRMGARGVAGLATPTGRWTVHDSGGTTRLPGAPVRSAGEPPYGDVAVDEAAAGIEATLAMFADVLGRASYDDAGARVLLSVHYGRDYDNAFWDGQHLVFGDGDGDVFERFTKPVDVLAHEFGHAVTEHSAGLVYRGQPGALNESVSDVFAACLKQRLLGQDAGSADWLVGEGIFTPSVSARALRDMAAPGTAFDDPRLGRDPQVGHMDDYVVTSADNGGVHLNSGIPNRAFHLAATAIGGSTLEGAGRIWYDALVGAVGPTTDFEAFAGATVAAAGQHADAVRRAWEQVGVAVPAVEPGPAVAAAPLVRVRRSGGFAGLEVSAVADPRSDSTLQDLVDRCDFEPAMPRAYIADGFVYTFQVGDGPAVEVPEQALTDDLRELARRVLADR